MGEQVRSPNYGQDILNLAKLEESLSNFAEKLDAYFSNVPEEDKPGAFAEIVLYPTCEEEWQAENNPHVAYLIEHEGAHVKVKEDGTAVLTTEQSAISKALQMFAGKLRKYDQDFGTPQLEPPVDDRNFFVVRHAKRTPLGAFATKTNT